MDTGKLKPIVNPTAYSLGQASAAQASVAAGARHGKVVVTVAQG